MKSDPYWWQDAGPPAAPDEIVMPREADVLIIGAGLTGLSAARTLAKAGKQVMVLDAMEPGQGASSRNGGMIGGGHRLSFEVMKNRFGEDTALSLLREAHLDSGEFVKEEEFSRAVSLGLFDYLRKSFDSTRKLTINKKIITGPNQVQMSLFTRSITRSTESSSEYK